MEAKSLKDLQINTEKNKRRKHARLVEFWDATLDWGKPNEMYGEIDYVNYTVEINLGLLESLKNVKSEYRDAHGGISELLKEIGNNPTTMLTQDMDEYDRFINHEDNENEVVLVDFKISTEKNNIDVIYGDDVIWSNMEFGKILLTFL